MDKASKVKERAPADPNKLDAIKQILFGEIVQEYDEEFVRIKEMIEQLRQENNEHLSSLKQEISNAMEALNKDFSNRLDSLREDLITRLDALDASKANRYVLGDLFQEMTRKLTSENGQPSSHT